MKFTLSLLLAGVFFVGTAYAPGKAPAAPLTPAQIQAYEAAKVKVEAAQWPSSGDHEKPNVGNRMHVLEAQNCLPGNKARKKFSNYLGKCVQSA